jgi:hypothetical protein
MTHDKARLRTIVNQDGAAVLDTERGTISTLNTTGAYIWQALERGEREEEIVDQLARETGEFPDTIRDDMKGFIAALRDKKMLSRLLEKEQGEDGTESR